MEWLKYIVDVKLQLKMSARRAASKKKFQSSPVVDEPKYRKCAKAGCPAERPECFANGVERLVSVIVDMLK